MESSNVMKAIKWLFGIYLLLCVAACQSQSNTPCNRTVYGTTKYLENVPEYICIPEGQIIDDYARFADTNQDKQSDILAIKFNKKEDDQADGDLTYWNIYKLDVENGRFVLIKNLPNIVPPFIRNISWEYLAKNPDAEALFNQYPRRLKAHSLSFQLSNDTIRLSYKFDDTFGKSFIFIFDKHSNWFLNKVEYFIGELPHYWYRDSEFYYALNERLMVIETLAPKEKVEISKFDLRKAFSTREEEVTHLKETHIDKIDETKWSSIDKVKFEKCSGPDLPVDWAY